MTPDSQPLRGIRVVNFAVGMAGALVSKFLGELGAELHRVPPRAGDPFSSVYPAYEVWRQQEIKHGPAATTDESGRALLLGADICVVGGEDYDDVRRSDEASELAARFPRLIVLNLAAGAAAHDDAHIPAVDILVQARTGIVFEQLGNVPTLWAFQPTHYGAALQGLAGISAALLERERNGLGQIVHASLFEGALTWVHALWARSERTATKFDLLQPKGAPTLILQCSDGCYLHIALGAAGSKFRFYKVLGIDDPTVEPTDPGFPKEYTEPAHFFGDLDLLAPYFARRESGELLRALHDADIVADIVAAPGECWTDAQVVRNGVIAENTAAVSYVGNPVAWKVSRAPEKRSASSEGALLGNVTVLDLGAFVAGPFASMPLVHLGADVIKIEPRGGDPYRAFPRMFGAVNRGKRSIAVDMKTAEGAAIVRKLCERADVVSSNFRAGVARRLGIDAEALQAVRPDLIILDNAGFGVDGPKALRPAFDPVMQAIAGHEVRAGGVGNPPLMNRCNPVDFGGGLIGSIAVLIALYARARRGEGAALAVPLLNVALFLLSEITRVGGVFAGANTLDRDRTGFHPAEKIYRTNDGWIAIAARDEQHARRLAAALKLDNLLINPRSEWAEPEASYIAHSVASQTTTQVLATLRQHGVWAELCRENGEHDTLQDVGLRAQGIVDEYAQPPYGTVRGLSPRFRLSMTGCVASGGPPAKGQHTREILDELGYATYEIARLYEADIVA